MKSLKKILAAMLALSMAAGSAAAVYAEDDSNYTLSEKTAADAAPSAEASDEPVVKFIFTPETSTAEPGSTVKYEITYVSNTSLFGYALYIDIPDGFTLAEETGSVNSVNAEAFPDKGDVSVVRLSALENSGGEEKPLDTITLKIDSSVAPGDYTISTVEVNLPIDGDGNYAKDDYEFKPLTVTASTAVKGDVNGDGTLNVKDSVLATAFAKQVKTPTDEEKARADVNGDGIVNVKDSVMITAAAKNVKPLS